MLYMIAVAAALAGQAAPTAAAATPQLKSPAIKTPLREGARSVTGLVAPKPHHVEVIVMVNDPAHAGHIKQVLEKGDVTGVTFVDYAITADVKADDSFTVSLSIPLVAGEQVIVCAAPDPAKTSDKACHLEEVASTGDWGRVRAYFAGGVVFSKDHNDFSKQDLVLSFTLDKSWYEPTKGARFKGFNTFFDTRLTAVPVSQTTTTTPAQNGGGATPAPSTTTTEQFLDSEKAALMQGGLYIPFYRESWEWTHQHARNTVFIAPVAKIGLVTTISNATTTSTVAQPTTSSTTTGPTTPSNGVYKFYAFGFGLGHEKLSGTRNSSAEVISYVHVTIGKWKNFDPDHWRYGVEGRLKIPESPFQIGFDANTPTGDGKGDLRFLVGARFDLGELLGKLKLLGA